MSISRVCSYRISMRGIDGGACSLAVITRTEYLTKGAAVAIILFFLFLKVLKLQLQLGDCVFSATCRCIIVVFIVAALVDCHFRSSAVGL